jgi:glycerol-3-phosphate acyltransferase PlsY
MLALAFPVGALCCLAWLVTAAISRISSLSAIVAAASSTFWVAFLGPGMIFVLSAILTVLVFWRHRENIARLRAGTEPKIGQK